MSESCIFAPEALEELDRQIEHIAQLGDEWQPTPDNLRALVEAVMIAQRDSMKARQAEGIDSARKRGVALGRPRKAMPKNFEKFYLQWRDKRITSDKAAKKLGISRTLFFRWVAQWEQNNKEGDSAGTPTQEK